MRPRTDTARRWLGVAVVTVLASLLFAVLHLPSPVLFGSLVAGMLHALTSPVELEMPPLAFRLGQALVGAVIGALVQLPTLARLASDWPSVLLVTVGTLAISVAAGRVLAVRRDVSTATGAFALIAGGASGIVALARELGADDRVVTIVQYLRVLMVLLAMPLVTTLVFHPPSGRGSLGGGPTRWLPDLVFVAVAVGVGLLAQRLVRAPATALLGPMLVAVAVSASGVLGTVAVPTVLEQVGYALIGVRVGLRFTRASLRSIARLLPLAAAPHRGGHRRVRPARPAAVTGHRRRRADGLPRHHPGRALRGARHGGRQRLGRHLRAGRPGHPRLRDAALRPAARPVVPAASFARLLESAA